MENFGKHFLEKYQVHKKPEAINAAKKKEIREKQIDIVNNPTKRVEAYIERLEKIFLHPDPTIRRRNIELIKPKMYENTIIKKENFPESYFAYKKQLRINQGYSQSEVDNYYDQNQREKEIEDVIEKQKISLDAWIDYLTSNDCKYPADIKYFAMQGILKLGDFDSTKYKFSKRESSTVTSYHILDRTALSVVLGAMQAKHYHKLTQSYSPKLLELIDQKSDFGKLYAQAMFEQDQ
jgi:hypothetical protein